ncbi:MAG: flippase [Oscillospiraceae bacterium]|nr:flippase [Oscillospiraceae bacterium]
MKRSRSFTNFIYNSAYHIFAIIIPLITTPYISRKLGAGGIGEYSYAYSVASYFALFIKLGLANYGNRTIAFARGKGKDLSKEFWSIYLFQLLMGIVANAIYLVYCLTVASSPEISLLIMLYLISVGIDITWFFWGLENFKLTVTRDFIIKILTTVCIFVFIRDANDVWKYAIILSGGSFFSQALLWTSLKRYIHWSKPTWGEIRQHIKPNLVLFVPSIAVSFYKIMDKIMLGAMSSTVEVGFYQSSERVLQVPMALVTSLGTVMQPRMSNLISKDTGKDYLASVMSKSVALALFLSTSLGFGIMTVSKEFVPIFYGQGFEKCTTLFLILLPSCMFLSFTNVFKSQYMVPNKLDKEYTIALFTGAAVNLLFNSLLIPRIASIGAAWGTLFAEISVTIVITVIMSRKVDVWRYYKSALPFIISGLIMFFTCRRIDLQIGIISGLLIKIIISAVVYLISLVVLLTMGGNWFGFNLKELYGQIIPLILRRKKN